MPGHDAPRCPVCADLAPLAQTCGHCLSHPPRFSHVVCAVSYGFPVDGAIQRLKYGAQLSLVEPLADLLARRVASEPRPDLLVPMPLGAARLRERGFNQALEIARALSNRLHLTLAPHACRRIRDTAPQAALPFYQRRKNVRGVFACDKNLDGAHVAVVDDVITTGETLNEVARTLVRAGASKVVGWAVARTPRG
ncbi:MAG: ComF family protein [Betaproteobacteria bacterium]